MSGFVYKGQMRPVLPEIRKAATDMYWEVFRTRHPLILGIDARLCVSMETAFRRYREPIFEAVSASSEIAADQAPMRI